MRVTFRKQQQRGVSTRAGYEINVDGIRCGVLQESSKDGWFWYATQWHKSRNTYLEGLMPLAQAKMSARHWFNATQGGKP